MAVGAAGGAVIGPMGQKVGEGLHKGYDIAQNALNPSRVPELRDRVIRGVVGDRSPQVLANLAQAPNRITPGIPHQVAGDPGLSSLHRTLTGNQPLGYGAKTTNFMDQQAGDLTANLRGQSANLEQLIKDRQNATGHLFDQLGRSDQPISTNLLSRKAFSQIEPGGILQGSAQGKHLLSAAKPLITKHPDGQAMPPLLPAGKGLLKEAPAGVLSNIKQDINAMLRPEYQPKPGQVKIDAKGKALLLDFKAAIDEALNRSSPAKGNASQLNREANREFQRFSVPVNQTQHIRTLADDATKGGKHSPIDQRPQMEPNTLASSIENMKQVPKVWDQFNPQQRQYLLQIQKEAPGNVAAESIGKGTADEAIAASAVPKSIISSTRPLPGPMGRATSVMAKLVAGKQIGRVEDALAEIMSEPGGIQAIEQILRTQPAAISQATGMTPEALSRLFAASAPMPLQ
jgi:hypothetical protein